MPPEEAKPIARLHTRIVLGVAPAAIRVPDLVIRHRRRRVLRDVAAFLQSQRKIEILWPDRVELLVEAAKLPEDATLGE